MVEGEAQLEQRPEEVVRVGREPRGLDGRLAQLERLGQPAHHLERVALHEHQRHQQPPLAGGARDRDAAVGVLDRRVVALEVVLGPAEVVERLELRGQLGVGQPLDLSQRHLAVLARRLDAAPSAASPRASAAAAAAISGRSPSARAVSRAPRAPLAASARSRARRGRPPPARSAAPPPRRSPSRGSSSQARVRRRCASSWRPEPVLDRRAQGRQLHPPGHGLGRQQLHRLQQRGRGSARARRATAAPTRATRAPPPGARSRPPAAAAAPPRTSVPPPPGRAGRSPAPASSSTPMASSSPCPADCSTWWARSAGAAPRAGERRGRPRVGREPPAPARGLVDRAPHERMAEDEAPRHLGRAHEVQREQVVERGEALGRAQLARSPSPGPARTARRPRPPRRAAHARPATAARAPRPARPPRRRAPAPSSSRPWPPCGGAAGGLPRRWRARAARGRTGCRRRGRRSRSGVGASTPSSSSVAWASLSCGELDPLHRRRGEGGPQPLGGLAGAEREGEQHRRVGAAPQQCRDQLDRRAVAPVQVVEHQHEGLGLGQPLQQAPHGAVGPVALVGERGVGRPARPRAAREGRPASSSSRAASQPLRRPAGSCAAT